MKKKILVVDDEAEIRLVLKRYLEKRDYEVLEAEDSEECLDVINAQPPDLILLDVLMPGMDGWRLCRTLKQDLKFRDIPVSMISVFSDPEHVKRSLNYGHADHHIRKPIDFPSLIHIIESLIKI